MNAESAASPPLSAQCDVNNTLCQHPQPCPAPVLLLVLLQALPTPLLCPLPGTLTSAGIIATTETKLSTAVILVPGFQETN